MLHPAAARRRASARLRASEAWSGPAGAREEKKPMKRAIASLALLVLLGGAVAARAEEKAVTDPAVQEIDKFIAGLKIDKNDRHWKQLVPKPPKPAFDAKKTYKWRLETNHGPIVIKLRPDVAPMHVASTIYLTRLGFYDGLKFHRVIPGFMAQGGDPMGIGAGGPGYKYDGEFSPTAKHDKRGTLSMANAGPGTDGSQFFITFVPTAYLDGKHTVFGLVVDGDKTLAELEKRGTPDGRPTEPLEMKKATIEIE
jgi:cyclophilin family peptidyl-prolyl cis-trans isomerase